jgi:hypothetical protein
MNLPYFPDILNVTRPDKLNASKYNGGKDSVEYHVDFGRYGLYSAICDEHKSWLNNCYYNRNFWKGNQWIMEEDLEAFMKDDTNQSRNRIKVTQNYIRTIVDTYIGMADQMDITFQTRSLSYKAINRREKALEDMLTWTKIASGSSPELKDHLMRNKPIGEDEDETKEIFENIWVDEYEQAVSNLQMYVAEKNQFRKKQGELAVDLCITGLCCMKYDVHNVELVFSRVRPERFFWDRGAEEYDLSDAEFMGEYDLMLPSSIFELAQGLTDDDRKAINSFCVNYSTNRVPVYTVYFKDFEVYEYGYVMDEFGYPYLTRVNFKDEDSGKPKYTDKDLIPVEKLNKSMADVLGGKDKKKLYVDVIRHVKFIPREAVPSPSDKGNDVVLSYGLMPYQDTEFYDFCSAKFPYKVYCWEYDDKEVCTPISQLISPQRLINRTTSVMENYLCNMSPPVLAYDKDLLDARGGEEEFLRAKYQGKPIGLNSRGRGIHNAVSMVSSTNDGSVNFFSSFIQSMRGTMLNIVGVNEAQMGVSQGSDQLVGVTAMQIQRGSIIQEPFYKALVQVYEQCYNAIASVGKRVYVKNNRKVPIVLGDKGARVLVLSDDYNGEDFRTFVKREESYQQQINLANQQLLLMLQSGFIDEQTYADNYGRVTLDQVGDVVRKGVSSKAFAAKKAAVQQEEQQNMATMMMAQEADRNAQQQAAQQAIELNQADKERENKTLNTLIKSRGYKKNI